MRLQKVLSLSKFLAIAIVVTLANCEVVWTEPELWNRGLPSSIKVFQTNSSFVNGLPMTASYCKFNLSDPTLELKVVHTEVNLKTPLQFAQEHPTQVYMAVNAGFFDMITNLSLSLTIEDSNVIETGESTARGPLGNPSRNVTYYPTVSAFGVSSNRTADISWVYNINNSVPEIYAYPSPATNCFNCTPDPIPSATFPSGGQAWNVTEAVGGGPILLKNGQVQITTDSEKISEIVKPQLAAERNPRTAICINENKEIIVLAVDGRYSLSRGLYLDELANLMLELGCKDAMNFDGGGSTALVVNGFTTNRPSDITGMRPVTSAILLVKKDMYGGIVQCLGLLWAVIMILAVGIL